MRRLTNSEHQIQLRLNCFPIWTLISRANITRGNFGNVEDLLSSQKFQLKVEDIAILWSIISEIIQFDAHSGERYSIKPNGTWENYKKKDRNYIVMANQIECIIYVIESNRIAETSRQILQIFNQFSLQSEALFAFLERQPERFCKSGSAVNRRVGLPIVG